MAAFKVGAVQGSKLQLEYWKVMEDDTRWANQTGDFDPAVFNPDRHAMQLAEACCSTLGLGFSVWQLKMPHRHHMIPIAHMLVQVLQ